MIFHNMHCEWMLSISVGNSLALGVAKEKSFQLDSAIRMVDANFCRKELTRS